MFKNELMIMKKSFLLAAILLKSIYTNAQCSPDITTGLIAKWVFSGNAADSSGNGYNGTVNNAVLATDRCGNVNSSYYFDGIGTGQYISVANTPALNLNNTDFTISAWIKSDIALANGVILSKRNGPSLNNGYIYFIDGTTQKLGFAIAGGGPSSKNVRSAAVIDSISWKHVLASYSNSTDSMKIYINGALDTVVGSVPSPTSTSSPFRIGNDSYGQAYEFKGKIDDIRIFNRVLTFCDVDSLYRTLCSPTGTNDVLKDFLKLDVYPNPSDGNFIVSIENKNSFKGTMTITNSLGLKIQELELNSGVTEVNLNRESGLYFLTFSINNRIVTSKVVIR